MIHIQDPSALMGTLEMKTPGHFPHIEGLHYNYYYYYENLFVSCISGVP